MMLDVIESSPIYKTGTTIHKQRQDQRFLLSCSNTTLQPKAQKRICNRRHNANVIPNSMILSKKCAKHLGNSKSILICWRILHPQFLIVIFNLFDRGCNDFWTPFLENCALNGE